MYSAVSKEALLVRDSWLLRIAYLVDDESEKEDVAAQKGRGLDSKNEPDMAGWTERTYIRLHV